MSTTISVLEKGIQTTYSGLKFSFIDPQPDQVSIVDISHALSRIARYCGHMNDLHTVAQHSVHVAQNVPAKHQLQALLHDASEAYTGDLITPLAEAVPELRALKTKIEAVVAAKFNIPWPEHPIVKEADKRMLHTEVRDMARIPWVDPAHSFDFRIVTWSPNHAKLEFINAFLIIARRYEEETGRMVLTPNEYEGLLTELHSIVVNV